MTGATDPLEVKASIVVVGNFNPLIFQPEWLAANEIIGSREANLAREGGLEVLLPQVLILNLANLRLEVSLDRFAATAIEAPVVAARDFAAKCFRLLSHTPVRQVGINHTTVFRARRREDWDLMGDTLARKDVWGDFVLDSTGARTGGLRSLTMEHQKPDGGGYVRVKFDALETVNLDGSIEVNDHFELRTAQDPDARASKVVELLDDEWERSSTRALEITDRLRALCHAV